MLQTEGGLKQYLYETWLEKIVREQELISLGQAEVKARFKKLVSSGKVWLLLDGVNEISYADGFGPKKGQNVFKYLHDELHQKDWENIKVVLTCRLNEWESSEHSLKQACDTFRLLSYEYLQRNEYINRRFKGDKTQSDGLIAEIERHPRLKDLAKNPLRLAMLCYIWRSKSKLPDTKFTFYKKFEDVYFEEKLNNANRDFGDNTLDILREELGRLSLEALNYKSSPFLLKYQKIESFFKGRPDQKKLVNLVISSGWLNNIGKSEEDKCFTFFHPTFQEYFAALAIDDWDYFLPKEHTEQKENIKIPPQNANGKYKPYRIFESKWKEVILLWMGREVDNDFKEKKEEFIEHLIKIQDGWENFYSYRAYFLAAEVIAEFKDYDRCCSSKIVKQVVEWSCDHFTSENKKQPGEIFILPIRQAAMDVLERTDHNLVMNRLNIINCENGSYEEVKTISEFFERYPHKNSSPLPMEFKDDRARCNRIEKIVTTAEQLQIECANDQNHPVFWQAIERLGEIGKGNNTAISFLIQVFDASQGNTYLHLKSALHLAAIGISDATQIEDIQIPDFFVPWINEKLRNSPDPDILQKLQGSLSYISIVEPLLSVLSRLLYFYIQLTGRRDIKELIDVASKIKTIGDYSSELKYKTTFEELQKLLTVKDYLKIIKDLRQYLSSKSEEEIVIPCYTQEQRDEWQKLGIADYLYQEGSPSERFRDCYKTLWYCAQVMPYPEFYSAFNPESSSNE